VRNSTLDYVGIAR